MGGGNRHSNIVGRIEPDDRFHAAGRRTRAETGTADGRVGGQPQELSIPQSVGVELPCTREPSTGALGQSGGRCVARIVATIRELE